MKIKLLNADSHAVGVETQLDATRVPVQGEPNDDREVLDNVLIDAREAGDGLSAVRNRILAAGFSRATVPDAALAAIAAARVVCLQLGGVDGDVSQPAPSYYVSVGRNVVATEVLAALDGAPEPEWEVQYGRRNRETGALHWLTGDPRDDWWHENQDRYEHVKRYTSPPLPVEGESDD